MSPPTNNGSTMDGNNRRPKTIQVVDVSYKVLILGESRIGKTSIIKRLANNEFREQTISTVGLDFVNLYYTIDNLKVRLQVWDTAGQEAYRSITRNYFRNTKGIVLVFDTTDSQSFSQLNYWIDNLSTMDLDLAVAYLVGNKIDLESGRQVSYQDGSKLANLNSIKYFETSAKTGHNLNEIFSSLAVDILESNDMNRMSRYVTKSKLYNNNNNNNNRSQTIGTTDFPYNYNIEPVIKINATANTSKSKRTAAKIAKFKQNILKIKSNSLVKDASKDTICQAVVVNHPNNIINNNKKRKLSKANRVLNATKDKKTHFKLNCCHVS